MTSASTTPCCGCATPRPARRSTGTPSASRPSRRPADGRAVFLRAGGSDNHHDLGLFSVGDRPSPAPQAPGLYHLAWQVDTIEDLAAAGRRARPARQPRRGDRPRRVQEPLRQGSRRHRVRGDVAGPGGRSGATVTPGSSRSTSPPSSSAGPASPPVAWLRLDQRSQRRLERRVGELVAVGLQHSGQHPLAAEQEGLGPLAAEQQLGAERRDRHDRRAAAAPRRAS